VISEIDAISAFRDWARVEHGVDLPSTIVGDGRTHRARAAGKSSGHDVAYRLYLDGGFPGGWVQDWTTMAEPAKWNAKDLSPDISSPSERAAAKAKFDAIRRQRAESEEAEHREAAAKADGMWQSAKPCQEHSYLTRKGVGPHGVRVLGDGKLVIPLRDGGGNIQSVQLIDDSPSAEKKKQFLWKTQVGGAFLTIGDPSVSRSICVAEGFATAASVHEITEIPTVVAFSSGNMRRVSEILHAKYPDARIVVCADDDIRIPGKNIGLMKAREAAEAVGGVVAVPVFPDPRPPKVSDFNDLATHVSKDAVKEIFSVLAPPGALEFISSIKRLEGEDVTRAEDGKFILTFGVNFLDDAMVGILRSDVVLFGAKTGHGKTQAVANLALANCRAGKNVHYFALEAEKDEIERRLKFKALAALYYGAVDHDGSRRKRRRIRYIEWRAGKLTTVLAPFEAQANRQLAITLRTLKTYYRPKGFFLASDFARIFASIQNETDLVILDHFHFLDSEDQNENRAAQKAVKLIRDSALVANRPVVVVGHVRKSDPKGLALIPGEEDFRGSGDLSKLATKAIMIAPDHATNTNDPTIWSTFLQIVKCRQDSSVCRFVAQTFYDIKSDSYLPQYKLGRVGKGGWIPLVEPEGETGTQLPDWYNGDRADYGESVIHQLPGVA
jgi:phage/plasmid primase-like uncharacterized protein